MKPMIYIFFILNCTINLNAQSTEFDWLMGTWKLDSGKIEMFEKWQKDGDRYYGESYIVKDGEQKITETLFIEKFGVHWAYIAVPQGQQITMFVLIESENNRYVFENKEHDFPQRIIYNFDGKNKILAAIEGEKNGGSKKVEFNYIKI